MMLYPLYTLSSCLITSLNSHWNLHWIEQRRFCFNFSCLFVKGTYVLQDNNFQLLTQMSDGKQYTEEARKVCRYFTRLKFLIYLLVVWLENRSGKKNAKDKLQRLQISLTSKFLQWFNLEKNSYFFMLKRIYSKHILFGTTLLAHVPESFSLSAE